MKEITSIQNPYIKFLVQLQEKSKVRKRENLFLVEGFRELMLCLSGKYEVQTVLWTEKLISYDTFKHNLGPETDVIHISEDVYQKLAYRDTTEGIIAVVKSKTHSLEQLKLANVPLVLVAEGVEKPGNLGALLRTADAAAVDAVIVANPKTDLYNPNIVRSSVGCLFTIRIATGTTEEVIRFLKREQFNIYSATLQDSEPYYEQDYRESTAIVVGTEASGLTEPWRKESKKNICIPMQGKIDSMNVSVAAAILVFEAKRQRGFR